MLAIRMQRTGRKGHAMFRVVVQDARRTPTSGKIVAQIGNYDPHAKTVVLDKEKAALYLTNGAQPSERVARLLKSEGVKLPSWVTLNDTQAGKLKNPEKLRRNQPKEVAAPAEEAPVAEESTPTEAVAETAPAETPAVEAEAAPAAEESAAEAADEAAGTEA